MSRLSDLIPDRTFPSPTVSWKPSHLGWDVRINSGTPLKAPADATVSAVGLDSYGNSFLELFYPVNDIRLQLFHLRSISVTAGDKVMKGQLIGLSGGARGDKGAGNATGPHLHLQVKHHSILINPSQIFEL